MASDPDQAQPTFVLGVGAKKAGTSWLARYLNRSPEFEGGFLKEYHVFDSLDLASEEWMRRKVITLAQRAVEAFSGHDDADAGMVQRLAMVMDPELYFDYFLGLVSRDDGVRATGDLTPDYSMLSAERMQSIQASFARRGLRTASVFVMRDPVDRIWSHIRMKMHRFPQAYSRTPEEELAAEYADERYVRRTLYEQTIAALDQTFRPTDVHVGLYESMFLDPRHAWDICRVVGITKRKPGLDTTSNRSPRAVTRLPEAVARPVAEHFAHTYREVARLRPDLDIEQHWPHARWVL